MNRGRVRRSAPGWEQRGRKGQIKVGVFAIHDGIIVHFDGELLDARIAVEFGGQVAERAGALGDIGNDFLVIAPAFFGRQFGEIAILGIVMAAEILARDPDPRFAIIREGESINGFRFIAAILRGVNDFEAPAS